MDWHDHSNLRDAHAFLSPSKHSWVRYDDEKLVSVYRNTVIAVERGTRLHALACEHIAMGIPMPRKKETLCMYINDGIGYRMRPEEVLYASPAFFGTADTISFRKEPKISKDFETLRIHDLKTGVNKASMEQLKLYAALFCIEYSKDPNEMAIETRIYQNNQIVIENPSGREIRDYMNVALHACEVIEEVMKEEK